MDGLAWLEDVVAAANVVVVVVVVIFDDDVAWFCVVWACCFACCCCNLGCASACEVGGVGGGVILADRQICQLISGFDRLEMLPP